MRLEKTSPMLNAGYEGPEKHRANFLVSWMNKLAAAYRQEISLETQAMYLQSLSDLPLDRLDEAFKRAIRECRYLPTISEIRTFESQVEISPEKIEAAYQRRKQAQLRGMEQINGDTE